MLELLPVVLGLGIGFAVGPQPGRRAFIRGALATVALAVLVSALAGELGRSPAYALFDAGSSMCALVLTVYAQRVVRRHVRHRA